MHPNAQRVADAARDLGLDIEVRTFPEGTKTAADAAAAIGVRGGPDREVAHLRRRRRGRGGLRQRRRTSSTSASWRRRRAAPRPVGSTPTSCATATGYPIGGVPPFGHATALRVFVDEDLLAFDEVWAAAGTWNDVFALSPDELVRASGGTVTDLRRA